MRTGTLVMGIAMFCVLSGMASLSQAEVIFSDNFESHAAATSWVEGNDRDPGAPQVGAGWTIRESNEEYQVQVWRNPVTNGTIQTPYGDQFLHMWRESQAYSEAWGGLTTQAQTLITSNGNLRYEFDVYVMNGSGWNGNLGVNGWDSASPGNYTGRAFSVSFRGDGLVSLYTGVSIQDDALNAVFDANTWEHVIIDSDFTTDTWSITIDGVTVSNLAFAAGDLSKIQQISLAATDRSGMGGRGGFDNVLVTTPVPEPATMGLLAAGGLGMLIRRKQ